MVRGRLVALRVITIVALCLVLWFLLLLLAYFLLSGVYSLTH